MNMFNEATFREILLPSSGQLMNRQAKIFLCIHSYTMTNLLFWKISLYTWRIHKLSPYVIAKI